MNKRMILTPAMNARAVLTALAAASLFSSTAAAQTGMSGSGAPYLQKAAQTVSSARSLHLQARIVTRLNPPTGKPQSRDSTLEVAWAPGGKFLSRGTGPSGHNLLVGTGRAIYIYNPRNNTYVVKSDSESGTGEMIIHSQLGFLFGPGAAQWTYRGVQTINGHSCDSVSSEGGNPQQAVFLDRTTHLPWYVRVAGTNESGAATMDVAFVYFNINQTLPATLFQFAPPPGAKRVTPAK